MRDSKDRRSEGYFMAIVIVISIVGAVVLVSVARFCVGS